LLSPFPLASHVIASPSNHRPDGQRSATPLGSRQR